MKIPVRVPLRGSDSRAPLCLSPPTRLVLAVRDGVRGIGTKSLRGEKAAKAAAWRLLIFSPPASRSRSPGRERLLTLEPSIPFAPSAARRTGAGEGRIVRTLSPGDYQ